MNILIIETVWMGKERYHFFDKLLLTMFSILPTLQARQVAAITPKHHTVTLINERYTPIDFTKKYDIVHINFGTGTSPRAYQIADTFRNKGIFIVLSGWHASALPDEAKNHADCILLGRPELNWLSFLQDFENNCAKQIYPYEHPTKATRIPPTLVSLPGFTITGAIEATRGCPFHCSFCPESNTPGGTQFYTRPVDDVIDELKQLPQKTIMFYDASLTINPAYTKTLFRKMQGLGKRFFCNGNSDVLAHDQELVLLSKQAGCIGWLIGFESILQESLDSCGKQTNQVTEYQQAIHNIHAAKIPIIGCFMFGFDTDQSSVFTTTLDMLQQLKIDVADFCVVTPFPGTPLFSQLENEKRILSYDWSEYSMKQVVFKPKAITVDELQQGVQKMYQHFYSVPWTIRRLVHMLYFGLYPFVFLLFRSIIATMNSRRVFIKKQ